MKFKLQLHLEILFWWYALDKNVRFHVAPPGASKEKHAYIIKREKMKIFTKTLFFLKKNPMTFFKNPKFSKIMIFPPKSHFFQ